jgi:hypothetical protein
MVSDSLKIAIAGLLKVNKSISMPPESVLAWRCIFLKNCRKSIKYGDERIMNKVAKIMAFAAGVLVTTTASTAGTKMVLVGSIESVDLASKVVTISGHHIVTADATRVVVGQVVKVFGTALASGKIVNAQLESGASYTVAAGSPAEATSAKVAPTLTGGGGVGAQLTGGGGVGAQLTGGGGVGAQLTGGGGVDAQLTGGGGVGAQLTGGGGVNAQLTGGGGVDAQLTGGGGAAAE